MRLNLLVSRCRPCQKKLSELDLSRNVQKFPEEVDFVALRDTSPIVALTDNNKQHHPEMVRCGIPCCVPQS